ncbi:ATP-binding protein [Buchnera aphidicola]|uniref:ATP-binding protein n=1 Tax=Buchnera aphidicola TaxID=9 RepID=UPI003464CD81
MQNIKIIQKLKNIIPNHIIPKFKNEIDLLIWKKKQEKIFSKYIIKNNKKNKIQNIIKNSGIKELYKKCSFQNYQIEHKGHEQVLLLSKNYIKKFNQHPSNFIFLGKPGTGKNHLACAISNHLIENEKKVLLITISDLMLKIKSQFNSIDKKYNVEKFIQYLTTIDLLILDGIGIQKHSRYENLIINQIIETRSSSKKSTGMLSNLNFFEIKKLLGERIIDRMKSGNSLWLNFNWKSFRKKINY